MDFESQRRNMVESQVRPSDVTDRRIVKAMLAVPREEFVPDALRALAYMDAEVPLLDARAPGGPRALMPPRTLARLIQLAEIEPADAVLVVGAATGYAPAVISHIAATLVALECDERLLREAKRTLARAGAGNVTVVKGDLAAGWPDDAPYDAILLDGAVAELPPALLEQLKQGGRLVAVQRRGPLGRATIWRRLETTFDETFAFDAPAPVLPGFDKEPAFAL